MAHLPHSAARLLRRSRVLTPGEKDVWQELAEFGNRGCWLTAAALGERIAMRAEAVEQVRRRLVAAELVRRETVTLQGKHARTAVTWIAVFPDYLVPRTRTPTDHDLALLTPQLEAHLAFCLDFKPARNPIAESASTRAPTRVGPSVDSGSIRVEARSASRGEGGRGEGSPNSHPVDTTGVPFSLPTPVRDLRPAREAAPVATTVRPALAETLAREIGTELDQTIESEKGVGGGSASRSEAGHGPWRSPPRDLQEQLDGLLRRVGVIG